MLAVIVCGHVPETCLPPVSLDVSLPPHLHSREPSLGKTPRPAYLKGMAAPTLLSIFPKPEDLLAVAPEDLAGVIVEVMPPVMQNGLFNPSHLVAQVFRPVGPTYPGTQRPVLRAITEAISWLVTQGILAPDLEQP